MTAFRLRLFENKHLSERQGIQMTLALFSPFKSGNLDLKNRLVMAPMTRYFSPNGVPTPDVAAYYRRRAEGEIGLIILEARTSIGLHRHVGGTPASFRTGLFWHLQKAFPDILRRASPWVAP
jgi:hypothetical protein